MRLRVAIPVALMIMVLCSVSAYAGLNFIPNQYGLSARGMAMGNALTAATGDSAMTFFNPATLGTLDYSRVTLGYVYGQPRFTSKRAGADSVEMDTVNDLVNLDLLLSFKNLLTGGKRGISLGLSLTLDDNGSTFIDFADHRSDSGQYLRYGNSSATIVTGLGVEVMPWLMLGAGAIIQLEAEVQMNIDTDLEGNTINESFDQVASTVITPTAGVLVPWNDWAFGAAWRAESVGQVGPIAADTLAIVGGSDLATLPLEVSFRDSFIPMQTAAGVQWNGLPELKIVFDVTWMQWSRFVDIVEENDDARDDIDFDFNDTFVPRLGAEYIWKGAHALRAGYSYEMTPIEGIGTFSPSQHLNVNGYVFLDNDKHVASVGYGYTLRAPGVIRYPIRFDLALQLQYLVPRTEETSDGVKYDSEGMLWAGGFNVTFGF